MDMLRTYPEGVTSWVDIEYADLAAGRDFYGGLFGWAFRDVGDGQYVVAHVDGHDVAGLGAQGGEPPSGRGAPWNTYVAVDDADRVAGRVSAAGGRVVLPPTPAGDAGRLALCEDTEGAPFRLWEAAKRPGAQLTNAPGTWNFSDLRAADPATAETFYSAVFGWEVADLGFAAMIRRPGYADHLAATVDPGIRDRHAEGAPPGFSDAIGWLGTAPQGESPCWHVTFAVHDRDEIAAAAERLGGTVLSAEDTEWTLAAVVRDPQGADFTVSQFSPS